MAKCPSSAYRPKQVRLQHHAAAASLGQQSAAEGEPESSCSRGSWRMNNGPCCKMLPATTESLVLLMCRSCDSFNQLLLALLDSWRTSISLSTRWRHQALSIKLIIHQLLAVISCRGAQTLHKVLTSDIQPPRSAGFLTVALIAKICIRQQLQTSLMMIPDLSKRPPEHLTTPTIETLHD